MWTFCGFESLICFFLSFPFTSYFHTVQLVFYEKKKTLFSSTNCTIFYCMECLPCNLWLKVDFTVEKLLNSCNIILLYYKSTLMFKFSLVFSIFFLRILTISTSSQTDFQNLMNISVSFVKLFRLVDFIYECFSLNPFRLGHVFA